MTIVKTQHGPTNTTNYLHKERFIISTPTSETAIERDCSELSHAIDVITHITKRETDGGRKFGYYAAILSGKNDRGLLSLSTTEHFASSFLTSAGSDFTFTSRMHKVSTGPNAH